MKTQKPSQSLLRDTRGATSVEYALMLVLILIVVAVGYKKLGETVNQKANAAEQTLK